MKKHPFHTRLVKPEDLNPANALFGGRIMEWIDEVAALYAMRELDRTQLVTKKVTELDFLRPARVGDYLEFFCETSQIGTTSLVVNLSVSKRVIGASLGDHCPGVDERGLIPNNEPYNIVSCKLVFVAVDANGKPTPHKLASL